MEVRETEAGSLLCPVSWSEEEESCEGSLMEEYSKHWLCETLTACVPTVSLPAVHGALETQLSAAVR